MTKTEHMQDLDAIARELVKANPKTDTKRWDRQFKVLMKQRGHTCFDQNKCACCN